MRLVFRSAAVADPRLAKAPGPGNRNADPFAAGRRVAERYCPVPENLVADARRRKPFRTPAHQKGVGIVGKLVTHKSMVRFDAGHWRSVALSLTPRAAHAYLSLFSCAVHVPEGLLDDDKRLKNHTLAGRAWPAIRAELEQHGFLRSEAGRIILAGLVHEVHRPVRPLDVGAGQ